MKGLNNNVLSVNFADGFGLMAAVPWLQNFSRWMEDASIRKISKLILDALS